MTSLLHPGLHVCSTCLLAFRLRLLPLTPTSPFSEVYSIGRAASVTAPSVTGWSSFIFRLAFLLLGLSTRQMVGNTGHRYCSVMGHLSEQSLAKVLWGIEEWKEGSLTGMVEATLKWLRIYMGVRHGGARL